MKRSRGLSHTQSVIINRLATPLGAFLILVAMGRHSDQLLGSYALVMTYYFVMQMLPLLGLTPYVMRETARQPEKAGRYFVTIGFMSMLGCIAVDAGCFALLQFLPYPDPVREAIAIVGALIFPGILLFMAELILMSLQRAKPLALVALAENATRLALTIAALQMGSGLIAVVWIFFFTRTCALVAYLVVMRRWGILPRFEWPDPTILRETVRVLPAFLIGAVLFVVVNRLDFLVLSLYQAVDVIGNYAIAYRVYDISINLLTAIIMAAFPWIARKFVGARMHFRAASRNIIVFFVAGLAAACFAGGLLAEQYVLLLFPKQYPQPVLLTQLFVVALFIAGVDFIASGLLYASDRQAADTRCMAAGGGVTVGLLFALVPAYGAFGAYVAKLAASALQSMLKFVAIERSLGHLWRRGELARLVVVPVVVAALAIPLLHAGILVKTAAILLMTIVILPALLLWLGILQPLRFVRYYYHPRLIAGSDAFNALVASIAADARAYEHARRRSRLHTALRFDRELIALVAARVETHAAAAGRHRLAALLKILRAMLGRRDAASPTRPPSRADAAHVPALLKKAPPKKERATPP